MQKMKYRFTEDCSYFDEEEVLEKIRKVPSAYRKYQEMDKEWKQGFLDFCMGRKTYCLVALDVFSRNPYPKDKQKLSGWLSFLTTANPQEAKPIIEDFPWLAEIYQEMFAYRQKPEEVLGMFSEALRQLDKNTVQYMIEEQQKVIEEQKQNLVEKDRSIAEKDRSIAEKEEEIARLKQLLRQQQ